MPAPLTDDLSEATQAQFALLQQRYVAGLAPRWAEIAGAGDDAILKNALHRLTGSAASFGFARLGQCARDAERLSQSGSSAALQQALSALKVEIERAQSSPLSW